MANLNAANLTEDLEQRIRRLREEIDGGQYDFGQLVVLADDVAASADSLASTFIAIDQQLGGLLETIGESTATQRSRGKRQTKRRGAKRATKRARRAAPTEESTKSDLLDQAKEAAIAGRTSMSKDELAEAVEAHEQQTKEELLGQAQELDIPGRSEMSKQELLEALRTEASVSRDELLDRAKEAEIPGRSEMSKDELREALQRS